MLYALIVTVLATVVLVWPAAAMGVVLCTFGLEQWAMSRSDFFFRHQELTNLVTAGLLGMALVIRVVRGQKTVTPLTRSFWFTLALVIWALLSCIWSIDPETSWSKFKKVLPYLTIFGFLMPMAVADFKDLRASFNLLLAFGMFLLTLLVVDTKWEGRQIVLEKGAAIGSVISDKGSPLAIATLAGQVGLVAVLLNFRGASRIWHYLRWGVVLVALIVAFKTGSRGQLFAFTIAALVALPISRPIKNVWAFLGVGAVAMVFLAILFFVFEALASGDQRWSAQNFIQTYRGSRVSTAMILLGYWAEGGPLRWIMGLGSNASYYLPELQLYPHLVMLEVLGELGLIGFFLLWMIPICGFRAARRALDYIRDNPEERSILAVVVAFFLFDIILSFKQGTLLYYGSTFAFGMILSRLYVYVSQRDELLAAEGYYDDEFADDEYASIDADADADDADSLSSPKPAF